MDRVLGVAIGIATVCLLFSILASHIQEIWASFSARRAVSLESAIRNMLSNDELTKSFFAHPLIQSISFSPTRGPLLRRNAPTAPRPSYIASDQFNKVLQSTLTTAHDLKSTDLPSLIQALPDSLLKNRLKTLTAGIEQDAAACNAAVEKWYDETMDRINGFYKRNTQIVLLAIGFVLAIVCNVNLLRVGRTLWSSAPTRNELNALAEKYHCGDGASCTAPDFQKARSELETDLNVLPIGHQDFHPVAYIRAVLGQFSWQLLGGWLFNLCGWLLAAIAISLGAPFWFDLINKFINIRMVGQKPPTGETRKSTSRTKA